MTQTPVLPLGQQFREVLRALPGFVCGTPARWLLRAHAPEDWGVGVAMCSRHRHLTEWPCREWLDADEALTTHPTWRLHRQ